MKVCGEVACVCRGMTSFSSLYRSVRRTVLQNGLIEKGDLIIVAVSGGADSLSLLHVLNRLSQESRFSFSLHVAHLDHGLRGARARRDADFVRSEAKRLGLPCSVGRVKAGELKKELGLSPEDAARRLRYRFLEQLALRRHAGLVAAGHNRDDQAETLLLNLFRGTGPDGLSGMELRRELGRGSGVFLIRPLLGVSRNEIDGFCRDNGLRPCFDRTNLDLHYLRNMIRRRVIPFLEENVNPNLREALDRLSQLQALDRDYWNRVAAARLAEVVLEESQDYLVLDLGLLSGDHEALQGRVLRLAIRQLLGSVPRRVSYMRMQELLGLAGGQKPGGTVVFPGLMEITRRYNRLLFRRKATWGAAAAPELNLAPDSAERCVSGDYLASQEFAPVLLSLPGDVRAGGDREGKVFQARFIRPEEIVWPADPGKKVYLDLDKVNEIGANQLLIRTRKPGDLFYPLGAPGKKKLKDYFIDRKLPREIRDNIKLVISGKEIIWVVGCEISHLVRVTEDTKHVLMLSS